MLTGENQAVWILETDVWTRCVNNPREMGGNYVRAREIENLGHRAMSINRTVLVWVDQSVMPCNPYVKDGAWLSVKATSPYK